MSDTPPLSGGSKLNNLIWVKNKMGAPSHSTPIFLVQVPNQFDAFFNRKNTSEKNAQNITPSIIRLEQRTSSRATDVVWH